MPIAPSLARACAGEVLGTLILVFFGVGAVHAAVLTGAQAGIWQVAVVWGVAISLAIYATSALSGTHINPAITLALVCFRSFPFRKAPAYILAQLVGAFLGAVLLYGLFGNILQQFEAQAGLVRGQPGSELSAMVYGEYFPNPAIAQSRHWTAAAVSLWQAMLAEGLGTAFLAFFVFALTDAANPSGPGKRLLPVFVGLTVSILISVIAPLTQAGFNPARDFGPRLFAWLAGWGNVAIPGPRGGFFTVYILAPVVGAITGAGVYQNITRPGAMRSNNTDAVWSPAMQPTRLVLVGGFLGAGKTTLLWEAAKRLMARGRHVGLITNDQAPELVDSRLLARQSFDVEEVAGSCFCCNFQGLLDAAGKLLTDHRADILIGEPVGSCTDLSATILQPIKQHHGQEFELAPLSVLADPFRLLEVLTGQTSTLHPSAAYIVYKQLEEADWIVINKVDLLTAAQKRHITELIAAKLPGRVLYWLSAQSGEGVDEWLDSALQATGAGQRIVDVDYDTYAEGEAVLGWLNASIGLTTEGQAAVDWQGYCTDLIGRLKRAFEARQARIGHVKLLLTTMDGHVVSNLTRSGEAVSTRGQVIQPSADAQLVVNARVEMTPQELEQVVRSCISAASASKTQARYVTLRSLSPGRPQPTHRFRVVAS